MSPTILADCDTPTAPRRYELTRARRSGIEIALKETILEIVHDAVVRGRIKSSDFEKKGFHSTAYKRVRYREYGEVSISLALNVAEAFGLSDAGFKKFAEARYAAALQ